MEYSPPKKDRSPMYRTSVAASSEASAGGKQRIASNRNPRGNGQTENTISEIIGHRSICMTNNRRRLCTWRARACHGPPRAQRSGNGCWEPEIHRLRGELYLQLPRPNRQLAESCFRAARDGARQRRERSLELRALTSLARLQEGKRRQRETLTDLENLVRGFSEGHETPDLLAARRLLQPE